MFKDPIVLSEIQSSRTNEDTELITDTTDAEKDRDILYRQASACTLAQEVCRLGNHGAVSNDDNAPGIDAKGTPPDDPDTLLLHAFVLRRAGYPNAALRKSLAAMVANDGSNEAVLLAAELYIETGDASSAYELLQEARHHHAESLPMTLAFAETCMATGRSHEAIRAFREVLTREPASHRALIPLSVLLCDAGDPHSASEAWDFAIAAGSDRVVLSVRVASLLGHFGHLDLADKFLRQAEAALPDDAEIAHLRAAIHGKEVPERAHVSYLRRMFDRFAESYDMTLKSISNSGPELIEQMLEQLGLPADGSLAVLDAGCGTGLCGPVLVPYARRLVGIDLSEAMLAQARNRGCYDETRCGDILDPCLLAEERFDLIVSSDVLVYFGSLEPVLVILAGVIRSEGYLVITLELLPDDDLDPFRLRASGRYQHNLDYVDRAFRSCGFEGVGRSIRATLRREYGAPVDGLAIAARRVQR